MAHHFQTKPLFAESHTEVLRRFIEAAASRNQQQTWSDNATRSEAQSPSCYTKISPMECNDAENDTNDKIAAEGLVPLSERTCTPTNKKAIMEAPCESPGNFSSGDERDRQRMHNSQSHIISKRQKLTPAGEARKAKYALLRTRQKERLFQSKMACLLQPKPLFSESHTEALHRVIEAASAVRNQQQIWSDNGTRIEPWVQWFPTSEGGFGGRMEYSKPE